MSAYIVSDATIASMVKFLKERNAEDRINLRVGRNKVYDLKTPADFAAVCRLLLAENYKSVNYRYSERERAHRVNWASVERELLPAHLAPVQVLKTCNFYQYQTCEHPRFKKSEAYEILEKVRHAAIRALPGYEEAKWGLY